jgi:phosphoglycerate dehydrogenase-like enzyme
VNTARGPVIDEAAMVATLQEGRISVAAVDVLEVEPIKADHPAAGLDNMIVTPHTASSNRAVRPPPPSPQRLATVWSL